MAKFEITIDAYTADVSRCFHKIVESDNQLDAEDIAERLLDNLVDDYDFDEWEIVDISEYTETEHNVGDLWMVDIEH